jgi:hypothetical protein
MSIELVRDAFSKASGLTVRHAALTYVGNAQLLEFDGIDGYGKEFKFQLGPFYGDPQGYAQTQGAIYKNRILDKVEQAVMPSKAKAISDRLADARRQLDAELDSVGAKIDAYDAKKPQVLARVHSSIAGLHSEVDGLDADLKLLSNSE